VLAERLAGLGCAEVNTLTCEGIEGAWIGLYLPGTVMVTETREVEMMAFQIHSPETAPEGSKPLLKSMKENLGRVPNLAAAMSESPQLLAGFLAVRDLYFGGTFTPGEIQVLSLTAAYENGCAWCMAFHTLMALKEGVPQGEVDALRAGLSPSEPRLKALSAFAREMVSARGAVSVADVERFCAAGYTRAQALEVVLGMAFSLMANYAGHLVDAPLEEPFQPYAWHKPETHD
jgi:AhpD family alkylhydroperoxidase